MSNVKSSRVRPSRRWFCRDDESGLTTLEWLLIVAAVAGLAALAVVLVTNVVDDTSEQISGSDTRETAARLAADEITQDVRREAKAEHDRIDAGSLSGVIGTYNAAPANPPTSKNGALQVSLKQLNQEYGRKCENLGILYNDLQGVTFAWRPGVTRAYTMFIDDTDHGSSQVNGYNIRSAECIVSS